MRFTVNDEQLLESWISKQLYSMKQNSPDEVAKYVVSVLKREDKSNESLKAFCVDDLRQFLKDKTELFVNTLFVTISDGGYRLYDSSVEDDGDETEDFDQRRRFNDSSPTESDNDDGDTPRHRDRRRDSETGGDDNHQEAHVNSGRDSYGGNGVNEQQSFVNKQRYDRNNSYQQHVPQPYNSRQQGFANGVYNMMPPHVPFGGYGGFPGAPGHLVDPYYMQPPPHGAYPPMAPPPMGGGGGGGGGYDNFNYFAGDPTTAPIHNVANSAIVDEQSLSGSYEDDLVRQNPQRLPPAQMMRTSGLGTEHVGNVPYYASMTVPPQYNPSHFAPMMPPPYPYQAGIVPNPHAYNKSHGAMRPHGQSQHHQQQLPESERYTLKCTHIPSYVTEQQIRAHFESFGHIVELQITPMVSRLTGDALLAHDNNDSEKKVNNEALVQFASYQNAKKCFNSPVPVLNNRFIKLVQSHFNIIPPADVEPLTFEEMENDRRLLTKEAAPVEFAQKSVSRKTKAPLSSTHSGLNMYAEGGGASNKYRRVEHPTMITPVKTSMRSDTSINVNNNTAYEHSTADDLGDVDGDIVTAPTVVPVPVVVKEQDPALKEKFEQLKALRSQQESIWKQKEEVLQSQVEKCRKMMEQLEAAEESESRSKVMNNLESKIVDLQSQLRSVKQQIEKGFAPESTAAAPLLTSPYAKSPYRGRGRGNSGGGRFQHPAPGGRSGYAGRHYQSGYQQSSYRGRGGGRGGRGRMSVTYFGNQSLTEQQQQHQPEMDNTLDDGDNNNAGDEVYEEYRLPDEDHDGEQHAYSGSEY